jgi:hypothetical protein
MAATDVWVLGLLQAALVLFAGYAVFRDTRIRIQDRTAGATAEVNRGDKSMAALYTVYGAAIASFLVLIHKASGIKREADYYETIDWLCKHLRAEPGFETIAKDDVRRLLAPEGIYAQLRYRLVTPLRDELAQQGVTLICRIMTPKIPKAGGELRV